MRLPFRRRDAAHRSPRHSLTIFFEAIIPVVSAITFHAAPSSNLDFSYLGRVAVTGDFSGISLFEFQEQKEATYNPNGIETLLARAPNGAFVSVATTDAGIQAMCEVSSGVVLGGNFTSVGGMESPGVALYNPNTSTVTPLPGLSGQVNTLYCETDSNTVYVGGNFVGANSTNALAWKGDQGWKNLPFAGFNGPVTSITKASNGHIIFGGSFTGLGNASTPSTPDNQIINLSNANISSGSTTAAAGFSDPRNIVCKTNRMDGPGNTWLLEDNKPGFWQANFGFGFQPSKLRLYTTRQDGRGTKTWRFTAFPINGIMNFTYMDPATGNYGTCTSECPLSSDSSVGFQDFHFVNTVGMNSFRIDISAWYGSGGGLSGIEVFENDIYAYAISNFNEPTCAGLSFPSTATVTGNWSISPSFQSSSEYLTVNLSGPISTSSASVVFSPDIKESGHYSVNVYTPGCLQDDTCATRGQFWVSGQMTATGTNASRIDKTLFQTNNYDKYDHIYFGDIDAASSSFRPTITMTPAANQNLDTMTFVAQKVSFSLINSTGGLAGLFEYDPSSTTINTSDFSSSAFNALGSSFANGSAVNALATLGDVTYIGGNFSSATATNIVSINGNDASTHSLDGGLNGEVNALFANGINLFVGGNFTDKFNGSVDGLNNVAVFDTMSKTWSALGAGVNGEVLALVPLTMIISSTPEVVITVSGTFTQLEAFGSDAAVSVAGFGIWLPSQGKWLNNFKASTELIRGALSSAILDVTGTGALYGGSLSAASVGADDAASLNNGLACFAADISAAQYSSGTVSKRDFTPATELSGVVTGLFDTSSNRNLTILAGHFHAAVTNGSIVTNLVFIDGSNTVTGLPSTISSNSTFTALAIQGDNLFAGGNVSGIVNGDRVSGLISWSLASSSFNSQPPALTGGSATVKSVKVRPDTGDVYVGGNFESAGSLSCPGICFFSTSSSQWNQAGSNLGGTVNDMMWVSKSKLIVGGNLTLNDSTAYLSVYDANSQAWDAFPASNALPGPVDAITAASEDGSEIWVAGTAANGSVYWIKYDGTNWAVPPVRLGLGSLIRDLHIFTVTETHQSAGFMENDQVLMLAGALNIDGYGMASAAIFNGATLEPYILTVGASDNSVGWISSIIVEKDNVFNSSRGHLALGFVVLIGLAISLCLMFLIVAAGLLLDRLRKKRDGYVPAPTSMYDRGTTQRIPPHELLENMGKRISGAPQV